MAHAVWPEGQKIQALTNCIQKQIAQLMTPCWDCLASSSIRHEWTWAVSSGFSDGFICLSVVMGKLNVRLWCGQTLSKIDWLHYKMQLEAQSLLGQILECHSCHLPRRCYILQQLKVSSVLKVCLRIKCTRGSLQIRKPNSRGRWHKFCLSLATIQSSERLEIQQDLLVNLSCEQINFVI